MHSGFFAMRGNMPFDLSHDAPLSPVPADVQAEIERCRRCGPSAVLPLPNGPYLFGRIKPGRRIFCTHRRTLRTYQVKLSAVDQAYVETLYQWPAFKAWQKAGLEEIER